MLIVLVFGALIYMNPRGLFGGVREVLWVGATPFMYTGYKIGSGVSYLAGTISSVGTVRDENQQLREKIIGLEVFQAQMADVERENEMLRKELDLLPRDTYTLETGAVIGYDPNGTSEWLVINKGSKHGLEVGMPVIVQDAVLVGSVSEVFYATSHVQLITHPKSTVNAHVSSTHVKGLVRGRYGLGILLDRILQTETVQVGEKVVTSEIGELFPPGLYIGQIEELRRSEDDLFQQALLSVPVEFSGLAFVSVVKK